MLYNIFYAILKMSCTASVIAVPLLSAKYIFQKLGCPRKILFLLWAVVAFRLVFPVSVSTDISVFNAVPIFEKQDNETELQVKEAENNDIGTVLHERIPNEKNHSHGHIKAPDKIGYTRVLLSSAWLSGAGIMIIIGAVSFIKVKRRLRFAVKLKENVYTAENIPTSFVFGMFKPKIFIPENTEKWDIENIIMHEKMHIKRADHITKIIAYILLSVYWFDPLIWVMFNIFSNDMEFACDEDVIKEIGIENKKQYLNTILVSALHKQKPVLMYNVCFSAKRIKRRVKNIIKLKQHPKGAVITGVILCFLSAVVFGTNAAEYNEERDTAVLPAIIPPYTGTNSADNEGYSEKTEEHDNLEMGSASQQETETEDIPALAVENRADIAAEALSMQEAREENAAALAGSSDTPNGKVRELVAADVPMKESQTESMDDFVYANDSEKEEADVTLVPVHQEQLTETEKKEVSDSMQGEDIDLIHTVLGDDITISSIEQNLNDRGITAASKNNTVVGDNYIIRNYSYENGCHDSISNVSCGKDGNMSLYFDINAENLVDVIFTDSVTKEVTAQFGILANDVNLYSFIGLDEEKTYDVTVQGRTNDTWKVEGQYIIY